MWQYNWSGINLLGESQNGYISASSQRLAKQQLLEQGIVVQHLKSRRHLPTGRIHSALLNQFFQQLAVHLRQGVPILYLLQGMAQNHPHQKLKKILENLQHDLSRGSSFFEAMKQHPHCFSPLVCQWVRMGEQLGVLPDVFQYIADDYAQQASFKQRLHKALAYPITVLCLASVILWGLMLMVIPQFEAFYHYFAAEMPWPTRCLIAVARTCQHQGLILLLGGAILGYTLKKVCHNQPGLRRIFEYGVFATPFVGQLLKLIALTRLVNALRTTYACSLSLVEAFEAMQQLSGYQRYHDKILNIIDWLKQGEPVRIALQREQLFPNFMLHLFRLGEEMGTLHTALQYMSTHCEHELDQRLTTLTTVFEPLLMALLGISMGALMLALYLPILNLGNLL